MRDRLIDLLKISPQLDILDHNGWGEAADYLLANGVIVPPCKVGDKIYYLDRHSKKVEEDTVRFLTITEKNGVRPILIRHNTKFWDFYEWGKTVFLTKEEAERALVERMEKE